MSWWKSLLGFENNFSKNILKDIAHDPTRLITGVDPASTKLWNGVLGTDNQALVNPLGSPGQQYYDRAAADGIDTGPAQGFHKVADVVAGAFGANGLAGIGGAGAAGSGGAGGAVGGAGTVGTAAGGSAAGGGGLLSSLGGAGGAAKLGMSVAGPLLSAYSSNKAAQAQVQSGKDANAELARQYDLTRQDQLSQYDQARTDQAPYREAGTKSLVELMNSTAPGGQFTKNYERAGFEVDPGYQFRLGEGQKGIQRAAAARGGVYSGATLKALSRFNQDTASQEYGAWDQRQNTREAQFNANRDFQRNNLAALAGVGQTATTATSNAGANAYGQIANAGANASNGIVQNMTGMGNARASGYVGGANAVTNGISQYMNYTQGQDMLNMLKNKPPTTGAASGILDNYLSV